MKRVFLSTIDFLKNLNSKVITGILIALLAVYIVITFVYAYIGPDASFYLKIALDLSNGVSFYDDMNVAYNPLGIYIFSLLFYIYPDAGYYIINSYFLIFYFANAFLFYKILSRIGNKKAFNIQLSIILLISLYVLQGSDIYLEPIVLLFLHISVYLLLVWEKQKKNYLLFLVGTNIFLAFFSKQYGLFIIPAVLYFIYIKSSLNNRIIKNLSIFITGFITPLIIIFTYFIFYKSIAAIEFLNRIVGLNYLKGEEVITGVNYHFLKFIESNANFIIKSPVLLVLFFALFIKQIKVFTKESSFYFLVILGGSLQLLFASYFHYYQLIIPFCLMLIANIINENSGLIKLRIMNAFKYLSILFILTTCYWLISDYLFYNKYEKEQSVNKELLQNIVSEKENVYLQGISPSYYFICKYNSPNFKELGYRFAEELSLKKINESLPEGSYIIIEPRLLEFDMFKNEYDFVKELKLFDQKECVVLRKKIVSNPL